ncbi:D-amino acid dehydrogenase [Acidovorax sp. SUPP2522]|uniref:D-amino acid dehydrogenase n=1 Tax=unclassified Acidovorax TaxID=2684926 RepID=UPI00234C0165|nr:MULTISPECIES: D-amino acid dehydrogenase [unclassified Acidovorax]WCM97715.1 D-amino acid dehydrogenase [Acidovorax sp. GBBC 1281]GKT13325.1 D-amino acid dehydrogenase [Acidovorax sp. SUPP2522]
MKTIVLGAGIIGISTAWHLLERGHEVTVVDRQPGAALETSFANAGQISVSYCEPWANRDAPLKALKWMFDKEAPLLFRPQLDWDQWRWGLKFLAQCNDAAFERNVQQIVALGAYSHAALKDVVRATGIEYHRLERGIAHFYTDQKSFDAAGHAVEVMRRHGVQRRLVSRDELLQIEPAFRAYGDHITGGTYTSTDESGDARLFTQELARRCAERGVQFLYGHDVVRLNQAGGAIESVAVRARNTNAGGQKDQNLTAHAIVVACGTYSAPLLRTVGVDLPIYPGKGYSATFPLLRPEGAPLVSTIDDGKKIAMSRLGNVLRVAGTIELGGYDLSLDSPLARARCHMLSRRIEAILPGVCDTRTPEEGGDPQYWTGLRPATPTNIPFIGRTRVGKLWVNAGHGTLGWTHGAGSGKAVAELISGERPAMAFGFLGQGVAAGAAASAPVAA